MKKHHNKTVHYTIPAADHPDRKAMDEICDKLADFIDKELGFDRYSRPFRESVIIDYRVEKIAGCNINEVHIPTLRWRLHLRHPNLPVHVARATVDMEGMFSSGSYYQLVVVIGGSCRESDQWGVTYPEL